MLTQHLLAPEWLGILAVIPLSISASILARQRTNSRRVRLGLDRRRRAIAGLCTLLSIGCLALAMLRPWWGHQPVDSPSGGDFLFLIDVSLSMAAEDAIPDRLGAAKEVAFELVRRIGEKAGTRAAVIAYAGRGVLVCPLTSNLGAVEDAIGHLTPGSIQPGGSDMGDALNAALELLRDRRAPSSPRMVFLLSDGEDHVGAWTGPARSMTEAAVVHSFGFGDPDQGHPIPIHPTDDLQVTEFLERRGETVLSRRHDEPLEAVARMTRGIYTPLVQAPPDSRFVLEGSAEGRAGGRDGITSEHRNELFPWILGLAFGLATLACFPRTTGSRGLSTLGLLAISLLGASAVDLSGYLAEGNAEYGRGNYDRALEVYREVASRRPDHPLPWYNAGSASFQLGRYEEARVAYEKARSLAGPSLIPKIDYALGNVAVALGDYRDAVAAYDRCLGARRPDPRMKSLQSDALINQRFARSLIPPEPADEGADTSSGPDAMNDRRQESAGPSRKPGSTAGARGDGGGAAGAATLEDPSRASSEDGTQQPPDDAPGGDSPGRLAREVERIREAKESRRAATPSRMQTGGSDWIDW